MTLAVPVRNERLIKIRREAMAVRRKKVIISPFCLRMLLPAMKKYLYILPPHILKEVLKLHMTGPGLL